MAITLYPAPMIYNKFTDCVIAIFRAVWYDEKYQSWNFFSRASGGFRGIVGEISKEA